MRSAHARAARALVGLVLLLWSCGGEVDPSSVVTADGQSRDADALYAPATNDGPSGGALGVRELAQLDVTGTNVVRLDLGAHGMLGVTLLTQRMVVDDERGDALQDAPFTIRGGGVGTCTLQDRWRLVDERRLGLLFACKDASREVVFVAPSALTSPVSAGKGWRTRLELESVGTEVVQTDGSPRWPAYRFELRGVP